MRESWTDKRLDDFRSEVGHRFDLVDQKFVVVDEKFAAVDKRFDRVEDQIKGLRGELNAHGLEMKRGFEAQGLEMKHGFEAHGLEMKRGFESQGLEMKHGFEAMHRLIFRVTAVFIGVLATFCAALIGAPHL